MSKQELAAGQTDVVSLGEEHSGVELLEEAATGLWEAVNNLTFPSELARRGVALRLVEARPGVCAMGDFQREPSLRP